MNKAQVRIVRFLSGGSALGAAVGLLLGKAGGVGKVEQVILLAIFGMMCAAIAAWFAGLK